MGAYVGGEDGEGRLRVWFEADDGPARDVEQAAIGNPQGLSWGYDGTGPANTALSILLDITKDRSIAETWHFEFRSDVVAGLQVDQPFRLERGAVEVWLATRGVAVAPEWETSSAVTLSSGPYEQTPAPTEEQLRQRGVALDARESAIERREHDLDRREHRLETWQESLQGQARLAPRSSLPVEPVKAQIEELIRGTGDELAEVARSLNVEPAWAAGVLDGLITEVDVDHVQRLCEGLRCTPHDFWGTEDANGIMEAYRPELWPRWIEPLAPPDPPPEPEGPDIGPGL